MVTGNGPSRSRSTVRTALASLAAALGVVLSLGAVASPASAAEQPAAEGWARIAHLSPDTTSVDVALTAVSGEQASVELEDVAYGDVSDYRRLPVGTFLVEMTPSDAVADTAPAVSQLVTIEEGRPITVAVLGLNSDLVTKVIEDDLEPPADGEARIRVLQASTVAASVDIVTTTGDIIAAGAASGQVTGYATVEDGPWDLELTRGSTTSAASVDLSSGSVNTLLVLDNASGGLTLKLVPDSEAVADTPVGGTDTGAAPTVTAAAAPIPDPGLWTALSLFVVVLVAVGGAVRRTRPAAVRAGRA